jgi:ankyrin repeat protein
MATFGEGYEDYLKDIFRAAETPGTTVAIFKPKLQKILGTSTFNINTTGYGYNTLLTQCVNAHNLSLVKHLIETKEYGVQIDAEPKSNCNTALIIACEFKDHQDIALYLIDKGADINRHGCINITPLMRASKYGLVNVVKKLLEKKVEIDATFNQKGFNFDFNGKNKTALYRALEHNQTEIVALLKGAGAKEDKETLTLFPEAERAGAVVKTTKIQIAFLIDALDADTIAAFKTFIGMLSDLENTQLAFTTYGGSTKQQQTFGEFESMKQFSTKAEKISPKKSTGAPPGISGAISNLLGGVDFNWDIADTTYKAIVHFGSSVIDMTKIAGSLKPDTVAEFVTAVKKQFSKIANENIDFITVYDGKPEYSQTAEIFQQEYNKSSRDIFEAMVITGNDEAHLATVKQLILDHSAVIARGAAPMPKANLNARVAPLRSGGAGGPSLPPASSSAVVRANGGAGGAKAPPASSSAVAAGAGGAAKAPSPSSSAKAPRSPVPTLAEAIAAASSARRSAAPAAANGNGRNGNRRNTRKNAPTVASVLAGWAKGTPIPEAFFKEDNIDHINTSTVDIFTAHITSADTYAAVKALRDLMKGDPKSAAKTAFRSKLSEVVNTSSFKPAD